MQNFEILKAKIGISRGRAIDAYDTLTEDDLNILEKLYPSHEINRIIALGKYYVLLNNIGYFVDEAGKLKSDTILGNHNDNTLLSKQENGIFHFIAWDNAYNHKIIMCYMDCKDAPEWVKKIILSN